MNRCDPEVMRKTLLLVEHFKLAGIDFIPIPVKNAEHRKELLAEGLLAIAVLATGAE